MANRYKIWNKTDNVITPVGEVFSPEQWIERYPAASAIPFVVATGDINGAFCTALSQMISVYAAQGADFSTCVTDEDKLDVIEAFEDAKNYVDPTESTAEERIAAAMEYSIMLSAIEAAETPTV